MKKLKHYLDGLHKCYLMNKSGLQAKYGSTNNPLINYVFSVFDEQIFLTVEPFQQVVMHGDSSMFYDELPTMISYWGWGRHPNLVKAYIFNLLCLVHWRDNRPDILRLLGSISKWINDVYVEHHHSIMSRLLIAMFPGALTFRAIRYISVFSNFARDFWKLMARMTHTHAKPNTFEYSVENAPGDHHQVDNIHSILRKELKNSEVKSNTRGATEPLKQLLLWDNAKGNDSKSDISDFLWGYFEELSQLPSNSLTTDEIHSMNLYRPVQLSKKYNSYWLHIFKEYRKKVLRRDGKARTSRDQSDLLIFLQDHTKKHTLKPLLDRLKIRLNFPSQQCGSLQLNAAARNPRLTIGSTTTKARFVEVINDTISHLVTGQQQQQQLIPPDQHLALVKRICDGTDVEDEMGLRYNHTKDYSVREWDRESLWEFTKSDIIPTFKVDFWKKVETNMRA